MRFASAFVLIVVFMGISSVTAEMLENANPEPAQQELPRNLAWLDPACASWALDENGEDILLEEYREAGFSGRLDWTAAVLESGQEATRCQGMPLEAPSAAESGRMAESLARCPTPLGDGIASMRGLGDGCAEGGGVWMSIERESHADSPLSRLFGYRSALRTLIERPWLADREVAYLHPAVVALAVNDPRKERLLRRMLDEPPETRPAVWPPLSVSGRYTPEEMVEIRERADVILASSALSDSMIWLLKLLSLDPARVNVYIDSTPRRASIRDPQSGKSYGWTGSDLTLDRGTLAGLQIEKDGYRPCPVEWQRFQQDYLFHCGLEPLQAGARE